MYKLKYFLWLIITCIVTVVHANDVCEEAIPLTLNTPVNGSTVGAGTEWANSCNYNKSSVWYTFTTVAAGDYNIKINEITNNPRPDEPLSLYNDVLTLYLGDGENGFSTLTEIMCVNDDEFGFAGENLYINLDAGTTYSIMVSSADYLFGKTEGKFSIEVKQASREAVDGEECGGAVQIGEEHLCEEENSIYTLMPGSNINASKANPQPSCYDYAGASIWYQVTATTENMQISTAPNFSEIITVYEGTCGSLEEIACKMNKIPHDLKVEEGETYMDELILTNLVDGQTYFIQITGTFASIEAAFSNPVCDDIIPYMTVSMDITCPSVGTSCNDNNPNTINDHWDENCTCTGTCPNILETVCDDGNPNTGELNPDNSQDDRYYDHWDENCECVGTCHLECPDDQPLNQATCECECNTICQFGQYLDENCTCQTCPTPGTACDDGYYYTSNDKWTQWCTCEGELPDFCPSDLTIFDDDVSDQGYFQASNSIITDESDEAIVEVEDGEQFALNAKKYVRLNPGFNAKAGSNFRAYIEGCNFDLKTDESAFASVKHYPNPFRDEVTLEFQLDFDVDITIIISDVNGRKVSQIQVDNLTRGIQTHSISTQDWIPGIYFYQVQIREQNTGILSHANGTLVKM